MPGFSHSMFTAARDPPRGGSTRSCAGLREMLFAGKFNLLFGLVFGIGFAIQMARLDAAEAARAARLGTAPRRHRATQVYARRLAFLFVVGLVHAMLIWSGDVLLVYALVGFALLGLRRLGDRALYALIAACLVFPALTEALRASPWSAAASTPSRRSSTSSSRRRTTSPTAAARSSTRCARPRASSTGAGARRSASSSYAVVLRPDGDRHPGRLRRRPARLAERVRSPTRTTSARAARGAPDRDRLRPDRARSPSSRAAKSVSSRRRSRERSAARRSRRATRSSWCASSATTASCRAGCVRCATPAGCRSATTCCRRRWRPSSSTAGASASGTRPAPPRRSPWRSLLFVAVQLPLSHVWLKRFRYGPLEYLWRRFTYGSAPR